MPTKSQKKTKANTISPERKPVVWKPWLEQEQQSASAVDAPYCPEVGTFYHITNLKR